MASTGLRFGLVMVAVALTYTAGITAQSSSGCTTALIGLSPCLNYPQCLCQLVNGGGSSLGITINQTRALGLPSACRVQTPPVSRCNGGGSPPSDSSNGNPGTPAGGSTPNTPSDDGGSDNTVPTTIGTSGGGRMELHVTLFIVLVASSFAWL
ncbi:unnamed protein product [Linum tenue]|uniref:Bifunctional inhibitor/plant lipid transfer protein/seed storage helical domain-containing protein n=1 Tax=Linum tenue TaxID=586396 RepID=A0AAV0JCH8_9ROSI|nr:unnamed protein product [Linum tenue]